MESLIPGLIDDLGRACLIRVPFQDMPTVSAVCPTWRSEIRDSEFHRLRKAAGMTRPVLVLGQAAPNHDDPNRNPGHHGMKDNPTRPVYGVTVFDPVTGSWTDLPEIPGLPDGLPMFCGLLGCGSDLVVIGGWDPSTWRASSGVYVYNFLSGKWRRGSDMPGPRRSFFGCGASDQNRTVVVAGGHDEDKNALKSVIMYDVAEDKWVALPDMERGRDECKVIFLRGKFHVISGYPTSTQGQFVRSVEAFDLSTWQWGPVVEDFLEAGSSPSSCVAGPGEMPFAFTGPRSDDVAIQRDNKWHVIGKVPQEVSCSQWVGMYGDKMVVIGSSKFGEAHNLFVLDLESYKWSKIDIPKEHDGHVQCGCAMEL